MSAKGNQNIDQAFLYLAREIKKDFFSQSAKIDEGDRRIFENEDGNANLTSRANKEQKNRCC